MQAEFGFILLIASSINALLLAFLPLFPKPSLREKWLKPLLYLLLIGLMASVGILLSLLWQDDFSVHYVASHSHSLLPLWFKIGASWGGHSGSMLWLTLLFSLASLIFLQRCPALPFSPIYPISVMASLIGALLFFLICFNDPFARQFPIPLSGADLNPMLQDLGLILHPPLLYLGYSAFAIVFALSLSALKKNTFTPQLAKLIQPWALLGWSCLTLGILVGSIWAYYELGWGGWWFWDPSENASLMPWLIATAFIHSLAVYTKKGVFPNWTSLFALLTFLFCLLGLFIVRSGVVSSMHAFNPNEPRSLALFAILVGFGLWAFIQWTTHLRLRPLTPVSSPYGGILVANLILSFMTFVVCLGTFYPLISSFFGVGRLSVGSPYFMLFFLPALAGLVGTMLFSYFTQAKSYRFFAFAFFLSLIFAFALYLYGQKPFRFTPFFFLTLASLLAFVVLKNPRSIPMTLAHLGLAVMIFSATTSSFFAREKVVILHPKQQVELSPFRFYYQGLQYGLGENFNREQALFYIEKAQRPFTQLQVEKRYYEVRNTPMSEVALNTHPLGDIYVVMGEKYPQGAYRFHLQYKPFMLWLWVGGLGVSIGGLMAFARKRKMPKWEKSLQKSGRLIPFTFAGISLSLSLVLYLTTARWETMQQAQQIFHNKQQAIFHHRESTYLELCEDAVRQQPNDGLKWLELGQAYMALERYQDAITAYGYAERLLGSTANILGLAGTAYYYYHQYQFTPKVKQLIQQALQIDPQEVHSLALLAHFAFQQQRYQDAIILWKTLLHREDPTLQRRAIIEQIQLATLLAKKQASSQNP